MKQQLLKLPSVYFPLSSNCTITGLGRSPQLLHTREKLALFRTNYTIYYFLRSILKDNFFMLYMTI
jgi:hypothetical protein